ncbi:MAG: pantoate--beta-alanine ligase [Planctomycetaceae bacterium]|nr:pantoate--beta-alanine ligase [Planctomycetaceae bacterium]
MSAAEHFLVITQIAELRRVIAAARKDGHRIGCVPTMGALHAGHISLFARTRQLADVVVATIFVNPSQFAANEDLSRYPRPLEADLNACREAGVEIVFLPSVESLYPPAFDTWVKVEGLSATLEGEIRPDHFRGVATIVLKLFNIVQPDSACFGQKDFQQQALIRRMVRDLDVPVQIVTCPTIREADGLALSSRNAYLNPAERRAATVLSRGLRLAEVQLRGGNPDVAAVRENVRLLLAAESLVHPDYVAVVDPDSLAPLEQPQSRMAVLLAARVGSTRLIDNCLIDRHSSEPSTLVPGP